MFSNLKIIIKIGMLASKSCIKIYGIISPSLFIIHVLDFSPAFPSRAPGGLYAYKNLDRRAWERVTQWISTAEGGLGPRGHYAALAHAALAVLVAASP